MFSGVGILGHSRENRYLLKTASDSDGHGECFHLLNISINCEYFGSFAAIIYEYSVIAEFNSEIHANICETFVLCFIANLYTSHRL